MLNEQQIYNHVTTAVCTVLKLDVGRLSPATALVGELGAESIDFLDMSCELEKFVSTEIDFKEIFKARRARTGGGTPDITLQDIVEYVKTQLAA